MTVLVLVSLGAMVLAIVMLGAPPPGGPPPPGPVDDDVGQDVRAVALDVVDALELDANAARALPSSAVMASIEPTFLVVMIDSFDERQMDFSYPVRRHRTPKRICCYQLVSVHSGVIGCPRHAMIGLVRGGVRYMAAERPEPRRLRKDAELNRVRIIAAAREVFRDGGTAATLNDVARHAGVGVATVYRRFADKDELVDALFDDIVDTAERVTRAGLAEPDAWVGMTTALEQVCEVQAMDRGLREVMLGTGRGSQRREQMRARVGPLIDELIARAKQQGKLRADIVPPDFPTLQLMLGAVTEHLGQPELWRRYLALLIDGMRARPDLAPLPARDQR